jgi:hypothetical protein
MIGHRIYPNAEGWLPTDRNPGDYGRATNERTIGRRTGWWEVTAPDGSSGSLNPDIHTITEHEDGTITVFPSLDYSKRPQGGWHGWLNRGVFTAA